MTRDSIVIKTEYWPKPIPLRQFDWTAVDAETYDGPGCPIGTGQTEQEAIDDLLEQLADQIEPQAPKQMPLASLEWADYRGRR